jgi:hypothetical protein
MTFSYDQIHLAPLSNLVFTLSLYMELQAHVFRKLQLGWYCSGEHTCITICSNSMMRSQKGPKLQQVKEHQL